MSPVAPGRLPTFDRFHAVCTQGLSAFRPLVSDARDHDPGGWNFGHVRAPSYEAYGRLRALLAFEHAVERRPRRVLEIAAGDAALSASLAAHGADVVANDLRSDELDRAIAQFTSASRIACLGGNVFDLDPRSVGAFDLVIACEVIEHVAHPDELLRTLARFVAPDGAILLTTPNGRYFRNQLPTFAQIGDPTQLEANQFKPDADGHLFLLTPGELTAMAADAGLQVEHILLWGTPFLSGGAGLRLLKGLLPNRACFWLERSVQQLPASTRARLTNSISALLRPRAASAHS